VRLAKPDAGGRTHPTFIEPETNRPLYVHRRGSNVGNGEYYVDYDPKRGIGHYSPTRKIDTAALRKRYDEARKSEVTALAKNSPLAPGKGMVELPRFFAQRYAPPSAGNPAKQVSETLAALGPAGFWPAPLPQTSYPYRGEPGKGAVAGDFAGTHVGDETDTSPFTDTAKTPSISTAEYLRRMNILVNWLSQAPR
jgi:hypothetical protein